nr:methyl-accepting chemotaxis protein [Desulfobacula sp.]
MTKIIHEVNELIGNAASAVENQTRTAGEITDNVRQVSSGFSGINENVAQASAGAAQIAREISLVDSASTSMTGHSGQVSKSATDLNSLAQKMSLLTGQFKLCDDQSQNGSPECPGLS